MTGWCTTHSKSNSIFFIHRNTNEANNFVNVIEGRYAHQKHEHAHGWRVIMMPKISKHTIDVRVFASILIWFNKPADQK